MKELEIISQERKIQNISQFASFQDRFGVLLPVAFKELMLAYEGALVKQRVYQKGPGLFFSIYQFLYVYHGDSASLEDIYEGHLEDNKPGLIPFAIDSGGWDYSYSVSPETFGQVWLNAFDSGEEDTYLLVATSLDDFIDNLMTEDEAVKKGY